MMRCSMRLDAGCESVMPDARKRQNGGRCGQRSLEKER
jgi:hypothetical protein